MKYIKFLENTYCYFIELLHVYINFIEFGFSMSQIKVLFRLFRLSTQMFERKLKPYPILLVLMKSIKALKKKIQENP